MSILDFDNHIYVTTDAESFFFLHDLISSYMREKERVRMVQAQQNQGNAAGDRKLSSLAAAKRGVGGEQGQQASAGDGSTSPSSSLPPSDWRVFECNTWHLEPTVRLISWAGSEIEPYGVDYILQRLGFSHARVTIPKWLQRGCMDPLDKALSVVVLRAVQLVQEEKQREKDAGQNEAPQQQEGNRQGLYEKRRR